MSTFSFVMRLAASIVPVITGGSRRTLLETEHDPQIRNCDKAWKQSSDNPFIGTIANGSSLNLDLAALVQYDDAGNNIGTIALANVRGFVIRNTSERGSGAIMEVGGGTNGAGATDAWAGANYPLAADADIHKVQPQSAWAEHTDVTAAWAVASPTEHILCLTASGGAVSYELEFIGE